MVRPNGNVLLGSDTTRPEGVADWLPDEDKIGQILACGGTMIPALKDAAVLKVWRAPRPKSCQRARPIRRVNSQVILAAGHYKIGYCLAPKVGRDILDFMVQT